jgi:DUF4097 and DUF4098 domain-containing protein YvlB
MDSVWYEGREMKVIKKIKFFIKKMKLREIDLNVLEAKSKCFDDAIQYINGSMEYEYIDAKTKMETFLLDIQKRLITFVP